jgi:hypothetical protein
MSFPAVTSRSCSTPAIRSNSESTPSEISPSRPRPWEPDDRFEASRSGSCPGCGSLTGENRAQDSSGVASALGLDRLGTQDSSRIGSALGPNGLGSSLGPASGKLQTPGPNGRSWNWEDVGQYDDAFLSAEKEFGIPAAALKAMGMVESDMQAGIGTYDDGLGQGLSTGLMQVKPGIWGGLAEKIGADLNTPEGQIRTAAKILQDEMNSSGSTWQEAFLKVYFPTDDRNGTTQQEYLDFLNGAVAEMGR